MVMYNPFLNASRHPQMVREAMARSGSRNVALALVCAMMLGLTGCAEMTSAPGAEQGVELGATYWRLVAVDDTQVPPGGGRRDPHIQFDPEKKRVTGYSGINIFSGGYDVTGDRLRMSQMASTRRAGPPEKMRLESAFMNALSATRSYRVNGDALEFLDANGQIVARFEGRATQ